MAVEDEVEELFDDLDEYDDLDEMLAAIEAEADLDDDHDPFDPDEGGLLVDDEG